LGNAGCHTDNYWQVYFDTNRVIPEALAEAGFPDPEFKTIAWFTMLAPAGTPKPILDRLEKEAVEIIHSTQMKARLQVFGLEGVKGGAAQFRKDFDASNPIIEKLVKISGAKMD